MPSRSFCLSIANSLQSSLFLVYLFNAGLVPGYIVVTQLLHLGDTIWALIVRLFYTHSTLMRSLLQEDRLPEAILESARIDGAMKRGFSSNLFTTFLFQSCDYH